MKKRNWPLIGYLWLAAAVAVTFGVGQNNDAKARHNLENAVSQAFRDSCERGNELRTSLRVLLGDSAKNRPPGEPPLTEAQKALLAKYLKAFEAKDCSKVNFSLKQLQKGNK